MSWIKLGFWASLSFSFSLLATFYFSKIVMSLSLRRRMVAVDVHKPNKPLVPTLGGLAILIGFLLPVLLFSLSNPESWIRAIIVVVTALLSSAVGIYDDFKPLKGLTKVYLTVPLVIPVMLGHFLSPDKVVMGRPVVPLVGRLRLTIIYWLLLPLAVAGPANAVNMLEVFNGVMPIMCSIGLIPMTLTALILGKGDAVIYYIALLGSLIGYYPYNKYPSRLFTGNVGSLMVGSVIGCVAILGGTEFVTLVALMPHLLNAFLVISTMRGLKERRSIKSRPIKVRDNGLLEASKDPRAPITLTRLILSISGPMSEQEVIRTLTLLEVVASTLATVSGLMYMLGGI